MPPRSSTDKTTAVTESSSSSPSIIRQRRVLRRSESSNMERGDNNGNDDDNNNVIGSSSLSSFESINIMNNSEETSAPSSKTIKKSPPSTIILSLLKEPTTSLPLLNFIDMFAVALVVPLLFQYYKSAGITKANQRELLSSVFSSSQILGGIILGTLTDSNILERKTVLFISFGGSAIAYAMIAYGNFTTLILSRILVGLVKQTMTITTSLMTKCTTQQTRAKYMGRLSSSTTGAWIFGPTIGGLLYKYVDHKAPVLLASFLFLINLILAFVLLPSDSSSAVGTAMFSDDDNQEQESEDDNITTKNKKKQQRGGGVRDFLNNLRTCTSSKALLSVICSTIIIAWMTRATSYANMGSYYEDMYGLEPHHRGYIQSYQRLFRIVVEFSFIGPILEYIGGERKAVCLACMTMAIATFWEVQQSLPIFLIILAPMISISTTMIQISMKSLLTTVAPSESIFSVFAVLDVLQNIAAVSVPFYRAALFQVLGGGSSSNSSSSNNTTTSSAGMEGDPDPVSWVASSGIHWALTAIAMIYFLSPYSQHHHHHHKRHHKHSQKQRSGAVKEL